MKTILPVTDTCAERGFIALMATIIIGALMLLLTATLARQDNELR